MIAIAPTDPGWFNQLRSRPHGSIVIFWTPTPRNVRQLKAGDRFYFLVRRTIFPPTTRSCSQIVL